MDTENGPEWLTYLDHTADVGIVVRGPALPTLFARAAWAMFAILTDPGVIRCREARPVAVEARDRAALLVTWLTELNYLHETRAWVFGRFDIEAMDDFHLKAQVWGEPVDPRRHTIETEIKAVTYHGLSVEQEDGVWTAQVIFDL